jgi:hypothetical protein
MNTLIERLKEPSTWAGLAGLALLFGLTQDQFDIYVGAVTGALSFAAIILKETK